MTASATVSTLKRALSETTQCAENENEVTNLRKKGNENERLLNPSTRSTSAPLTPSDDPAKENERSIRLRSPRPLFLPTFEESFYRLHDAKTSALLVRVQKRVVHLGLDVAEELSVREGAEVLVAVDVELLGDTDDGDGDLDRDLADL